MQEAQYLESSKQYAAQLMDFFWELIGHSLDLRNKGGSAALIAHSRGQLEQKLHKAFLSHPEKDRATWEVIASTSYGPWFNEQPLELLPHVPSDAPLQLKELLQNYAQAMDDAWEAAAIFNNVFEPQAYRSATPDERLYRQWLGLVLLSADNRPWKRDVLYRQGMNVHPDAEIRALLLSLVYIDLPW